MRVPLALPRGSKLCAGRRRGQGIAELRLGVRLTSESDREGLGRGTLRHRPLELDRGVMARPHDEIVQVIRGPGGVAPKTDVQVAFMEVAEGRALHDQLAPVGVGLPQRITEIV